MADVVLTSALRNNLQALQLTQSLIDTTQLRLSTGKKVNSALDNPQNFFAAQSLSNRSSDLTRLLDGIGQSIQTVKAADKGTASITKLVEQAESIANTAREKAASGEVVANATGDVDLSGIDDLVTTTAIVADDTLTLSLVDDNHDIVRLTDASNSTADTYVINFEAAGGVDGPGDVVSISDLITEINGIRRSSDGSKVFEAKLDSDGNLVVNAKSGYSYRAVFSNARITDALGLDRYVANREAADTALGSSARVAFTASNKAVLSSLSFTDVNTSATAKRGTDLEDLRDETNTAVFAGDAAGDNISVRVLLKDGTTKSLDDVLGSKAIGSGVTTQGTVADFVDNINNANSSGINALIKANFDEDTGQFTIESLDSRVIGVAVGVVDAAGANAEANFGFGAYSNALTGTSQVDIDPLTGVAQTENVLFAAGAAELADYKDQYGSLLDQIDALVEDSGYAGVNLVNGDTLKTYFNEDRSSLLETAGQSLKYGDLGLSKDVNFGTTDSLDSIISKVKTALDTVRGFGSLLANDLSIIQTREEFTKGLIETLKEGSDKLTLADQNEEGAKLLSLQTRQQLGITALSLASQAQQAVLRLF